MIDEEFRAQGSWRVLDVARPAVAGPSQVSRTQAELEGAWAAFKADGEAPTLQTGQAALLVSVAGDCSDPSAVRGVEQIRALRPESAFFAVSVDPTCVIIDRFGSVEPGPRSLLAVSLPAEDAETAVGVEAVTAPVASLDWEPLALETDPTGRFFGVARQDSAGMEWLWGTWSVTGDAPLLPEGRHGWVVPVPGDCREFASLVGTEAMGYVYPDGYGTVILTMQFDEDCAELASGPSGDPQTVYAISLGVEVSNTLSGPRGLIVCPPDALAAVCAVGDAEATRTLEGDRLIAIAPWE